jgi:hypothetical protein
VDLGRDLATLDDATVEALIEKADFTLREVRDSRRRLRRELAIRRGAPVDLNALQIADLL